MATLEATSPAEALASSLEALQLSRQNLEARRANIDESIASINRMIGDLLQQEQSADSAEKPTEALLTLEDLLQDPSYAEDERYQPSPRDEERLSVFRIRNKAIDESENLIRSLRNTIRNEERLLESGPRRVAMLRFAIADINGSAMAKIKNWFTGDREAMAKELATLEKSMEEAPKKVGDAKITLDQAVTRASYNAANTPYATDLHDIPAARLSGRKNQSVMIRFDATSKRKTNALTLHLPSSPSEDDFGTAVTFALPTDNLPAFNALIGSEVPSPENIYSTVGQNFEYFWDIDEQLVPFPLEVVQVDGQERFRLPQAVWEKFKDYIA